TWVPFGLDLEPSKAEEEYLLSCFDVWFPDCDESCLTCSGPDVNSSVGSWVLFGTDGSCVDECPAGYFKEESGQKCEPCHASCQTCVGKNSLQCLTCKAHLFREAKECVETCQPGHYGNSDSRTCEKCDPSCGECTDGGEEDCLSCSLGLVYLRNEGRCLPSCPPGYHRDSSHRTCEPCHSSCRTCSGATVYLTTTFQNKTSCVTWDHLDAANHYIFRKMYKSNELNQS
uniref:Growth factor receptor domain-containing protein n=1 Tax=Oryzias melastigma TaxID=30732 RepID=A0A3B3BV29_ORYME